MNNTNKNQEQNLRLITGCKLDHPDKIRVGKYIIDSFQGNGRSQSLFFEILQASYPGLKELEKAFEDQKASKFKVNPWQIEKIISKYCPPPDLPSNNHSQPAQQEKPVQVSDNTAIEECDPLEYLKQRAKYFLRIGTDYYLKSFKISSKNEKIPALYFWKKGTIIEDYGREILGFIKKYVSFVNIPDNTENFKQEIFCDNVIFYNLYEPLKYIPQKGEPIVTLKFLKHIFQDKMDVALDYLKILYEDPTQHLPVICLVSKIQKTGKTTFLQWLRQIFGNNAVILGNEDFSGKFNTHYASKLIIGVDESFIDRNLIKEKIKRLTTESHINMEAKGRDIINMDFIGKFILLSNKEDNFIQMDSEDTRFFVMKLLPVDDNDRDPDLLDKLEKEIPSFLYFLKTRKFVYPRKDRLWFDPQVYETEALRKIIISTRSKVEKEILSWFEELFSYEATGPEIRVIPKLLARELEKNLKHINGLPSEIEKILKDKWGLIPANNSKFYFPSVIAERNEEGKIFVSRIEYSKWTGTYYSISKEFVQSKRNNI